MDSVWIFETTTVYDVLTNTTEPAKNNTIPIHDQQNKRH